MTEKRSCWNCEATTNHDLDRYSTNVTIKGVEVWFVEESYLCKICGEGHMTKEQLGTTLKNARKAYEDLTNERI